MGSSAFGARVDLLGLLAPYPLVDGADTRLRSMRPSLGLALMLLAAACAPAPVSQPPQPTPSASSGQRLASGEFSLAAAGDFGDPGFHAAVTAAANLPASMQVTSGRLVLTLRDAGRPQQTCATEHPLSGCATVDWSDSPDRPHVPPTGVFISSVTLQLSSGPKTLYLSQSGALASRPDAFEPGWPHTAVGGSARVWQTTLSADLVPGSAIQLHLVMTKFGPPAVRIAYAISLVAAA